MSKLSGKDAQPSGGHQGSGARAQSELQEALNQALGERNLLRGEKERLERDLEGLRHRMEEMRRETERLRNKPCPPQTPVVPASFPNQDRSPIRSAAGRR